MKTCKKCNEEKTEDNFGRDIRSADSLRYYCKQCEAALVAQKRKSELIKPTVDTYTADTIKVLKQEEIEDKFQWTKAWVFAAEYNKDVQWVTRGLDACRMAGVKIEYFVERYLKGNRNIPQNMEVAQAFKELTWTLPKDYIKIFQQ